MRNVTRSLALFLLGCCIVIVGSVGTAAAKSGGKSGHRYEKVWPIIVRFLRVDERLKVTEKDPENGYVLFVLAEEGKRFPGAIEVIRRAAGVEFLIEIKDRPSYVEALLIERLERKIKGELGTPARPTPKKPVDVPAPTKEPVETSN